MLGSSAGSIREFWVWGPTESIIVARLRLLPTLQNIGMRNCTSKGATYPIGSTLPTTALCPARLLDEHHALHRLVPTPMHGTHTKYERFIMLKHTLDFHRWAISLKEKYLCIFCVQPLIVKPSVNFRVQGEKSDGITLRSRVASSS